MVRMAFVNYVLTTFEMVCSSDATTSKMPFKNAFDLRSNLINVLIFKLGQK